MRPGEGAWDGLRIEEIRAATHEEWDATWKACPYATYFHSREWAEVWEGYSQGRMRARPRRIAFSDGTSAVVPLTVKHGGKRSAQPRHLSSPAGTYGGWLSTDPLGERHAALLLQHLLDLPGLTWRVNPFDEIGARAASSSGRADHTWALRLDAGFEALLARWTKGHRSAAKKALREGVSVSVAANLDHWMAYFEMYRSALTRWGENASSSYGWDLFERLRTRSSRGMQLWLAHYGSRILAGALVFSSNQHVVYWHGASLPDTGRLRPGQLLLHEILRASCDVGASVFDFNPSGGHAGVEAFKKGFGAVALPAPVIRTAAGPPRAGLRSILRLRRRS